MIFTKKIFLKEIDSTSDYLIRLDKSIFVEEGVVVVTKFQERGRGRIGNSWISDPGKNLLFSFLLKPVFLPLDKQFYLSIISSISLVWTLQKYINKKVIIKWPNDILVNQKKIAGFLLDLSVSSKLINRCIIGCGINVNQTNFLELNNATSIFLLNESAFNERIILNDFLDHFTKLYKELKKDNFEYIKEIYLLMTKGFKSKTIIDGVEKEVEVLNLLEDNIFLVSINGVETKLSHIF